MILLFSVLVHWEDLRQARTCRSKLVREDTNQDEGIKSGEFSGQHLACRLVL
jgi:hypothetical protein